MAGRMVQGAMRIGWFGTKVSPTQESS